MEPAAYFTKRATAHVSLTGISIDWCSSGAMSNSERRHSSAQRYRDEWYTVLCARACSPRYIWL